jgi:hypothetical protein
VARNFMSKNQTRSPLLKRPRLKKSRDAAKGRIKKVSHSATTITEEKFRTLKFRPFAPSRLRGTL